MATQFRITSTGTKSTLVYPYLGIAGPGSLEHPVTDLDLMEEHTREEIRQEPQLQQDIDDGHITAVDENNKPIVDTKQSDINSIAQRIQVGKSGAVDYTSVKEAVDSITDNSALKPYVINTAPGVYIEDTITMKPYVHIRGERGATIINVNATSKDVLIGTNDSTISQIVLTGATDSGKAAIRVTDTTGGAAFIVRSCSFGSNYHNVIINEPAAYASCYLVGCTGIGGIGGVLFKVISNTGGAASIIATRYNHTVMPTQSIDTVVDVQGPNADFIGENFTILGITSGLITNGIKFSNGCLIAANNVSLQRVTNSIVGENIGSAPTVQISNLLVPVPGTTDVSIQHPGTIGYITGTWTQAGTDINTNITNLTTNHNEPGNSDVAQSMVGKLYQGNREDRIISISDLLRGTSSLGITTGGDLSVDSGLDLSIEAGVGFLEDQTDVFIKHIEWNAGTITLPDNTSSFVYIDTNGSFQYSSSMPSCHNNIVLGKVTTDNGSIDIIENIGYRTQHHGNCVERFLKVAGGPLHISGNMVTESGTRNIDVTGGNYYYGTINFNPSGGTAVTLTTYRSNGGGPNSYIKGSATQVDNSNYDDGAGNLVSLGSGKFTKHSLYIIGEGVDEKYLFVYGQAEYDTQTEAENADLPTPPSVFNSGSISIIASIVVQEGTSNIISILDERRKLVGGAAGGSGSGGTSIHGDLTGLDADDHTQYLLVDGTRSMAGNLNMNTNNITSVGTVDGVDISDHSSRHLPNGADPLTTGAASTIGTSNAEGILNSMARQDHIHDHGSQNTPTHHAVVTTSDNGFMSSSDKDKLDNIDANANNYSHPNHTGDVTSVGDGAQTIANNTVSNTKAADMAQNTIKGRISSGSGDPEDLSAGQVRTIINVEDGATADMTDSEIKTAYENNANTNAYTDSEKSKLSGIEPNAKDDQDANEVPYDNTSSGLAATDVQNAIDEIIVQGAESMIRVGSTSSAAINTTPFKIQWDTEAVKDSGFTHSTTTNPQRIYVDYAGTYLIGASIKSYSTNARFQPNFSLYVNGIKLTEVDWTNGYIRSTGAAADNWTSSFQLPIKLAANDYVEIEVVRASTTDGQLVSSNNSFWIIDLKAGGGREISGGQHASDHITGGGDEIDGDKLDIDFTPSNYTPDTAPPEVTNPDNLSSHLKGIDTAIGEAATNTTYSVIRTGDTSTTSTGPSSMGGSGSEVIITGVEAGNYLLSFGTVVGHSDAGGDVITGIYVNNTLISNSVQTFVRVGGFATANRSTHNYACFPITVGSGQSVEVKWATSSGTAYSYENRYMTLLKVS